MFEKFLTILNTFLKQTNEPQSEDFMEVVSEPLFTLVRPQAFDEQYNQAEQDSQQSRHLSVLELSRFSRENPEIFKEKRHFVLTILKLSNLILTNTTKDFSDDLISVRIHAI